jgi:hypothetical protein
MNYPGVGYPGKEGRISEELKQALKEELGLWNLEEIDKNT